VVDLAVRMTGITKSFSGVSVLRGVDFEVRSGEVHALVGGNGAGKSTLMKILEGVHRPDGGTIEVAGRAVTFGSSHDALGAGVGMIFQEFSLIPTLSVAQNVYLTREPSGRGGLIDDRAAERQAAELFRDLHIAIGPRAEVGTLTTAERQMTEIAKALSQEPRLLIMDEPTSSLGRAETMQLFDLMRRLRDRGISIVYISHRMEEIFEIADRITVLRDGVCVLTVATASATLHDVISAMIGERYEQAALSTEERAATASDVLLEVRGLRDGRRLKGVDLQLRRGEILGLAGLMGSGRTELVRMLFGIDRPTGGEILVRGEPVTVGSPRAAMGVGIGLIPEDRHVQGLVVDHTVRENLLAPILGRLSRGGIVDDREGDRVVRTSVDALRIRTRSPEQPVRMLSGGNQQKVVIAKWLATEPDILLMDEPTAGVDVATKHEIVVLIRALAQQGKAVLFISSELPELLAACDRFLVMRDGRVERELTRDDIGSEAELHQAVQGVAA